jgi:hypothetical protein
MDLIIELLTGPIGIPLIIIVTIAAVELYKRWTIKLVNEWWHDASVVSIAWIIGIAWSIAAAYANNEMLTWQLVVRLLFQGALIGMLASGGYKWLEKAWEFIGGARQVVRAR